MVVMVVVVVAVSCTGINTNPRIELAATFVEPMERALCPGPDEKRRVNNNERPNAVALIAAFPGTKYAAAAAAMGKRRVIENYYCV